MENLANIEFKVAMDSEQARLKNHHTILVDVSFEDVDVKVVQEMAMKAQIVAWQSQIRANWDKFLTDGLPSTITFGEALYESSKGKVTIDKARDVLKAQLSKMSDGEKLAYLKECGLL